MKLLLKQVIIADNNSPYNGSTKDILITDGIIEQIEDAIDLKDVQVIEQSGLHVSIGWVDIFSHFNDPGYEYKETLETGAEAAAAGGFTNVFILPETKPVIDNKASVEYIVQKSKSLPVNIHPLGAISKKTEGKELSEMYDMYNSGAVAFSDGFNPIQTPGLLLKALQYIKAIDAVLIQVPVDQSISKTGLVNEGIPSTQLGLPGIPTIAEELMVSRDIELAKYTNSKIHFTGVSTAKSLALIKAAKDEGVQVTCSVTPYHLVFSDEDLQQYDTNLKTTPPLRSRKDVAALAEGIINGTIDCIASHHLPENIDNKNCEFEYAAPGMIGLETTYGVINNVLAGLSTERLIELLSLNARKIFSLPPGKIEKGSIADLTLFERETEYTFNSTFIKSKSRNTPFINKVMKGKVIGVINKDKVYLNN